MQSEEDQPVGPQVNTTALGVQLTKQGENKSPYLSEDGRKFLFVSQNRSTHKQPQIYFFDLDQLKERRITYQNGESRDPVFWGDSTKIAYASSTDELKEKPLFFTDPSTAQSSDSQWPPTELYQSDIFGSEIQRLTKTSGFDGMLWPKGSKTLLYIRLNKDHTELFQINREGNSSPLLRKANISLLSPRPSPNEKQALWIERQKGRQNDNSAKIMIGTQQYSQGKALVLPEGEIDSANWYDNQKIYLSFKFTNKKFQIYTLDLKENCLSPLIEHDSNLTSTMISENKERVVFVSDATGRSQIYFKSLTAAANNCLKF